MHEKWRGKKGQKFLCACIKGDVHDIGSEYTVGEARAIFRIKEKLVIVTNKSSKIGFLLLFQISLCSRRSFAIFLVSSISTSFFPRRIPISGISKIFEKAHALAMMNELKHFVRHSTYL